MEELSNDCWWNYDLILLSINCHKLGDNTEERRGRKCSIILLTSSCWLTLDSGTVVAATRFKLAEWRYFFKNYCNFLSMILPWTILILKKKKKKKKDIDGHSNIKQFNLIVKVILAIKTMQCPAFQQLLRIGNWDLEIIAEMLSTLRGFLTVETFFLLIL